MQRLSSMSLLALLFCSLSWTASAEIFVLDDGIPIVVQRHFHPERGTSMTRVLKDNGEPLYRHGSVGYPPITRWDYEGYSVIFERRYVIHTVSHPHE